MVDIPTSATQTSTTRQWRGYSSGMGGIPGLPYSSGPALHLSVPVEARWPEVIVRVDPSNNALTGVQRVNPKD